LEFNFTSARLQHDLPLLGSDGNNEEANPECGEVPQH